MSAAYADMLRLVTPDAPTGGDWRAWHDWFRSLLPSDAAWLRRTSIPPDEPDHEINVEWTLGRRRWHVQQVGLWYEIQDGGFLHITTPKGELYPLRRVVALLRMLEALPPASSYFRVVNDAGALVLEVGAND